MQKYSRKIETFLKEIGVESKRRLTPTPQSASRIQAGELFLFTYHRPPTTEVSFRKPTSRVILVVQIKRAVDGLFISTQNNPLVSCFNIDQASPATIRIILRALYKRRRRASYYSTVSLSLKKLLGVDKYRTYNLTRMGNLQQILV